MSITFESLELLCLPLESVPLGEYVDTYCTSNLIYCCSFIFLFGLVEMDKQQLTSLLSSCASLYYKEHMQKKRN